MANTSVSQRRLASIFLCLLAAIALLGAPVRAGDMQMFASIAARYEPTTMTSLPFVIDAATGRVADNQPGIYKIDLTFTAQNALGDKGWGNTLFSALSTDFSGDSRLSLVPGSWMPNSATVDIPGSVRNSSAPAYAHNIDAGSDQGDLQSILVSLPTGSLPASDPRNLLGTAAAPAAAGLPGASGSQSYLGSFLIEWNGAPGASELAIGTQTKTGIAGAQFSFSTTDGIFGEVKDAAIPTIGFGQGPIIRRVAPPAIEPPAVEPPVVASPVDPVATVPNPPDVTPPTVLPPLQSPQPPIDAAVGKPPGPATPPADSPPIDAPFAPPKDPSIFPGFPLLPVEIGIVQPFPDPIDGRQPIAIDPIFMPGFYGHTFFTVAYDGPSDDRLDELHRLIAEKYSSLISAQTVQADTGAPMLAYAMSNSRSSYYDRMYETAVIWAEQQIANNSPAPEPSALALLLAANACLLATRRTAGLPLANS